MVNMGSITHRAPETYLAPLFYSSNALERTLSQGIWLRTGGYLGMTSGHSRKSNSSIGDQVTRYTQKLITYPYSLHLQLSNAPHLEGICQDLGEIEYIFLISAIENVLANISRSSGQKSIP